MMWVKRCFESCNLKWWTKRAQQVYTVWYFLVFLEITDVTFLHNNTVIGDLTRPRSKRWIHGIRWIKLNSWTQMGWNFAFRCWASRVLQKTDGGKWRLGWLTFEWPNFEKFWDQLLLRTFPTERRYHSNWSFMLSTICYHLPFGISELPKQLSLSTGGVSEDGEDWFVKEWMDGSKVSQPWLSS